jgi:hypothetical protein
MKSSDKECLVFTTTATPCFHFGVFYRLAAINGWGACSPTVLVYPNHFKPFLYTTTTCDPSTTS